MPPTQDNEPQKARVACVHLCQSCSITSPPHLVIENREVPLEENQATAISYTWGEFNRQEVEIGHSNDEKRKSVFLELGEEWTKLDVINRLDELSRNGPIWLDQLCTEKNDEAIRRSLAKIPAIFRTFPVVVLMPDRPCRCLHEFVHKIKDQNTDGSADRYPDEAAIFQEITRSEECLTFTVSSSWFRRLWTRQELMYSKSIRCVWAGEKMSACVPTVPKEALEKIDSAHFPRYLALKRQSFMDQGFSPYDASMELLVHQKLAARYGRDEMSAYLLGYAEQGTVPSFRFYDFLSGALLSRDSGTADSIRQFIRDIDMITQSFDRGLVSRKSTRLQDYALAVWPDCPSYVVPEESKTRELHYLMQDALNQLHVDEGYTILTTAPQGLFDGASHGSGLWHPDYYHRMLQSVKAHSEIDFRDVYGPIYLGNPLELDFSTNRCWLPLVLPADPKPPISATARDYHAYIAEMSNMHGKHEAKAIVIEQMKPIIRKWAGHVHVAVNYHLNEGTPDTMVDCRPAHSGGTPQEAWMSKILPLILMAKLVGREDFATSINDHYGGLFETESWVIEDITRVLYQMMAMALRLNEDICQKSGVRIMLSGREPQMMRLGFYRGDIGLSSLGSEAKWRDGIKSVRMDWPESDEETPRKGPLIYEAAPACPSNSHDGSESHEPGYRVFGVWIPLQDKTKGRPEYNAEVGGITKSLFDLGEKSRTGQKVSLTDLEFAKAWLV